MIQNDLIVFRKFVLNQISEAKKYVIHGFYWKKRAHFFKTVACTFSFQFRSLFVPNQASLFCRRRGNIDNYIKKT